MDKSLTAELLIVKIGTDYIRFVDQGFEPCPMNKGSVFALSEASQLQQKCVRLLPEYANFQIMKLTIFEEPFPLIEP
ncbi:hypothetical protein [Desulforhopalus sp. IMCC35007]|uniref:hypothetical protein n=1 Tax=Desulforhopalus sp. IMCC35007 TaxID=2569543 RepID=UPI0010AE227D|nr:hypothetical protein [Desulforhopalus sp. IMCC35007]TKB10776.1 hypothetical protein FCL48_05980 [Desulforhopalus sp. IMCC35007]